MIVNSAFAALNVVKKSVKVIAIKDVSEKKLAFLREKILSFHRGLIQKQNVSDAKITLILIV